VKEMGVVELAILQPQHEQRFQGITNARVRLRGSVLPIAHAPLFYRWYSSLSGALTESSSAALDTEKSLAVGSQALTFTAKDVVGDARQDIEAVNEAGFTGGLVKPGIIKAPCIVHVFLASMDRPAPGATLSKSSSTTVLAAVAPFHWGRPTNTPGIYEPNPDYHEINRLRYRWRFQPSGPPEGRASAELVPALTQLIFDRTGDSSVVRYQGRLPDLLGTGGYTLTLRVEDKNDANVGDEVSRAVVIAA
jgi:hypothetical protein